jgi:[calcium/calmodulin-dependent protein kinase] kinase
MFNLIEIKIVHSHGIVHRDIKPQNVLMSDGSAKIGDFGVSVIIGQDDLLNNTQGTYHFMPPEACDKDKVKLGFSGKSADVWALGVTFFCFTFLEVPFNGDNISELFERISKAE